jgi:hypothetical protein
MFPVEEINELRVVSDEAMFGDSLADGSGKGGGVRKRDMVNFLDIGEEFRNLRQIKEQAAEQRHLLDSEGMGLGTSDGMEADGQYARL